jgi:hypothetical protein
MPVRIGATHQIKYVMATGRHLRYGPLRLEKGLRLRTVGHGLRKPAGFICELTEQESCCHFRASLKSLRVHQSTDRTQRSLTWGRVGLSNRKKTSQNCFTFLSPSKLDAQYAIFYFQTPGSHKPGGCNAVSIGSLHPLSQHV